MAHTILFGVAHTILLEWCTRYFLEWRTPYFLEWRTRSFLSGAHDTFGSGRNWQEEHAQKNMDPGRATPKKKRPHMAIEGVLTRQKCAEKWCATFWDPCLANLVSQNSQILNFQDFRHSWKVTSSPSGPWTSKWVLGFPPKARGCRSGGLRRKYML